MAESRPCKVRNSSHRRLQSVDIKGGPENRVNCVEIRGRSIDLANGRVIHEGKEHYLAPRLLALLSFFVEHAGDVLTRDQIIESVWGHLDAATDDSVNVAVSGLRRELGDNRRPHRVLQAVPRRGYRLVPDAVTGLDGGSMPTAVTNDAAPSSSSTRRGAWLAAAAAGVVAVLVVFLLSERPEPVELAATAQPAAARGSAGPDDEPRPTAAGRPSVVVLPFLDMSANGDQQFFADGLVDRITHMLTQSPDLQVVARTSAFAFRDGEFSIRDIADRLQVDAVLEGSVQRSEDQVRVLAQLIETESEAHLWSRTFDRPVDDLFVVQDEIANLVSRTLTDTLLADAVTAHPRNREVHDLITRGRFLMDEYTQTSAQRAQTIFQQALDLDPDQVEALIGYIDAVGMERSQGAYRTSSDVEDFTETYLERARAIHPDHPLVLRATGDWHFRNGRLDDAERFYEEAVRRNPNDAFAHATLGWVRFRTAQYDDAIPALQQAIRLDPFSGLANVWLADVYWAVGRSEEALFRLRRIIRDRPEYPQAYGRMANYLAQTGETGEAARYALRQRELDPSSPARAFQVCESYLQLGDIEAGRECTDRLQVEHDLPLRTPYLRSIIALLEGDSAARVEALESIYEKGVREPLIKALLAEAYAERDCSRAIEVLDASFPELFAAAPTINPMNLSAGLTAVHCMQQSGDEMQMGPLLAAISEFLERNRIKQGPWQVFGYERAALAALNDDTETALDELEDLIDSGWRYSWWGMDRLPMFDDLRDHPRFRAALEALDEGVARQRAHFEKHRDEPLT